MKGEKPGKPGCFTMKLIHLGNFRELKKTPTNHGDKMRRTYRWTITKEGKKELVLDEEINQDEEIQSFLEETKIENIIRRATFDPTLWERFQTGVGDGTTTDITGLPGTLAEAQQLMIDVEQTWDKLPWEMKNKFGNSVEMFIHSFGSEEWNNAMGLTKQRKEIKKAEQEVTTE